MVSLHIAVFLFGLAGVLSKLLQLPAITIVWGRAIFAVLAILLYLKAKRQPTFTVDRRSAMLLCAQGLLLAVHWTSFFYAIQLSSVALGLLSFSTFPIFVLLLEHAYFRQRAKVAEVAASAVVLLGLTIIVPEYTLNSAAFLGMVWGVLSGCTFALLTVLNRALSSRYSPAHVALFQNFVAAAVLSPWAFTTIPDIGKVDWLLLASMGVLCTALAHSLFIHSLKSVRVFVASIVTSLEPVYGILAALLVLGEIPSFKELLGGFIILSATMFVAYCGNAQNT